MSAHDFTRIMPMVTRICSRYIAYARRAFSHAPPLLTTVVLAMALCAQLLLPPRIASAQTTTGRATSAAEQLPDRLTDAVFWSLINQISETEGDFPSDNFTSNEIEVGPLSGLIRSRGITGGVYMGVGPEQNFSYIAAIRPKLAFIVDIRRQAMVQHLMYKAIFELAPTRSEFVSLLFSLPRSSGIDSSSSIQAIWAAYSRVLRDPVAYSRNLVRIRDNITRTHSFALSPSELASLSYVYESFFSLGPQIGTRGIAGGNGRRGGPGGGGRNTSFMGLTQAAGTDGSVQTFLASEESYRTIRDLHARNLIVPVSGDFGGPRAIRAVGSYVAARGATITAFYLSNVEQYLFQDNKWRQFYTNVATLPVDSNSIFIRPYSMRSYPIETSLCPIAEFIRQFSSGRVTSNSDALSCAR